MSTSRHVVRAFRAAWAKAATRRGLVSTLLIVVAPLFAAVNDVIPALETTALDNQKVAIPAPAPRKAHILIFGFQRDSDKPMAAWDHLIAPAYAGNPQIAYYAIPVLEGVPGLIKPVILRGMRKSLSPEQQSRYAPIFEGAAAIKKAVDFGDSHFAYVTVISPERRVVWSTHAAASEQAFVQLRKALEPLLK